MKNLILAALLAVSPVTGLQDSLATTAATTISMEAAQKDLTTTLQAMTEEAAKHAASLQAQADAPVLSEPFEVEVTFYFASKRWGTKTASGNYATVGTIAADPSVPFGTQYYIPELEYLKGDRVFTVEDRGSAIKGKIIDIYLPNPNRSDPITNHSLRVGRFTTTAYRVLSPEEVIAKQAQKLVSSQAQAMAVASSTETAATQEIPVAVIPLEPNLAPKQDFNSQLHAQQDAKDL